VSGRVFIVGIGPGDPELLTLKAARILAESSLVLHAGRADRLGFAIEVVSSILRPDQHVRGMALAMKRGPDDGSVGYGRVADALIEEARIGGTAAFLTEGDPMLYGSGSYVADHVRELAPDLPIEIVPGVSAISAVAARLGWPLAQKSEILTLCPATYHPDDIGAILDRAGASCWLKAANVLPRLVEELRRRERIPDAALVERVGRPDERVFRNLEEALGLELSYFSLVLVRGEGIRPPCSGRAEAGTLIR
jgi:precorrin-2/cobalt-factor-2 C20-methyltransferase